MLNNKRSQWKEAGSYGILIQIMQSGASSQSRQVTILGSISVYVNVTSLKTAKQITNFVLHKTKKKKIA